ncbi:carbon-nitrogen hydrolase family protein [Sinorhizobium mexicanum]|uniref:Carbon-nitrogen hydrolase family protein n=1 Tax=Sinorhizobium mexicanum TaxID=375549 RepID=A0A859R148_9HYPH|nr:carbon-nitrogen hydrolase family protein [Sinorhizobium mexicanum]MBP1884412.1 nitrilase [Sinorhizobium mexicanum]QLL65349.1 carbon-nitrogen hydrolase family protein [Sinorhizobium mexicanum]
MSKTIKAAVVQAGPVLFDTPKTIAKLADLARDAAGQGAELVVFPEAFLGGYPKGIDFGARLGMRSPEGREDFRRYYESAIALPGPEAARLGEIARDNNIHLVVGIIERDGGTLYCSAVTYAPSGKLISKHRKLMPTALERLVWGFGDGSTIGVVDTPLGRIGSVICWENYMPLLRTAMYAQGIELYCAPTVDDRDTWLPTMRTIALEGRCFVISACQYFTRGDGPAGYAPIQGDDPATVLIRGGSCIVDPLGNVLIEPDFTGEAIKVAEIDRRIIARGKYDLDVVGHYARSDVFTLSVDTRSRSAVAFMGAVPVSTGEETATELERHVTVSRD